MREGEVFRIASLPPFHSLLCLPVSLFLSTHPTLPTLPLPQPPEMHTRLEYGGARAYTLKVCKSVCVYVDL